MQVERIVVGQLQANCYAVIGEENEALIIDPGSEGDKIIQWIKDNKWSVKAILITHGHFDHTQASDILRQELNVPLYINQTEKDWLTDSTLNLSQAFGFPPVTLSPAECVWTSPGSKKIGDFNFEVLYTPGHTPGSVCYYFPSEGVIFTGDLIFQNSVGRSDFPQGDTSQLFKSIKDYILPLPDKTIIYSGHGSPTTVGLEKTNNPFLQYFKEQ